MQPESLISVVMPAYNAEKYIEYAIKSVLDQVYTNWELIIIDDGSCDSTAIIAKTYLVDPRIRYVKQDNSGPAIARNTGILLAKGSIVAFLDADDYWHPNKLYKQSEVFKLYPDVDICSVQSQTVDVDMNISIEIPHPKGFYYGNGYPTIIFSTLANMSTGAFKKTIFDKHGAFDNECRFAEDYELFLRLARDSTFYVIPEVLACIRKFGNNTSISNTQGDVRRDYTINNIIPKFIKNNGNKYVKWYHIYKLKGMSYKNRADGKNTRFSTIYWLIRSLFCNPFSFESWTCLASNLLPDKIYSNIKKRLKQRLVTNL